MKYKKKPVIVDAIRYTGFNALEILQFCDGAATLSYKDGLRIRTYDGAKIIHHGNFVIKWPEGVFDTLSRATFYRDHELLEG